MRRTLLLPALLLAAACSKSGGAKGPPDGGGGGGGNGGGGGSDAGATQVDEESLPPAVYVAKVKNLLTGLPPTEAEIQTVVQAAAADPPSSAAALRGLVSAWIETPEWRQKMLVFFQQAFQQTQTDISDYDEQLGTNTTPWDKNDKPLFVRAAEESFARTALALIDEGRPFTEMVTTRRFMLNPPLMAAYAYMDAVPLDDTAKPVKSQLWLLAKFPGLTYVRTTNPDAAGAPQPIPLEETVDPASPNFMKWYEPKPYAGAGAKPECAEPETATEVKALRRVFDLLYGGRTGCGSSVSHFSAADWAAWRMVTVRAPAAGEERTIFWDLPKLRAAAATALVVSTPRVGFMTTPAFFANWPTNASNSYRVTTNQSLIVGLGTSFDDTGTTVQVSETSSDAMHVMPGTACYGCHQTLDPMRDFFKQSYSLSYFRQVAAISSGAPIPGTATFLVPGGSPVTGSGVAAFADAVTGHPALAAAWTQKLCQLANSASCDSSDPEFQRVAEVFRAGGFDWKTLVRELFSSRLVTFAARPVPSALVVPPEVVISIARRDAFCLALEARFQIPDFCSLRGDGPGLGSSAVNTQARNLARAIPGAGYARGEAAPLLPHDPNLFFHAATENLCRLAAVELVNDGAAARYHAAGKDAAIADFVSRLLGIPDGDAQAPAWKAILDEHYDAAVASGVTPTDALRSTFMLACQSPMGISLGL